MTDQQIDEFLEMLAKSPTSARDMVRGLFAAHEAKAAPAVPEIDDLAQFIRQIDGSHTMGTAALAERICEWLNDRKATEQAAPAVPQGWQVERESDYRIRVQSPSGEAWSFDHDYRGSVNLFVYEMLDAMLSATPAAPSQPAVPQGEPLGYINAGHLHEMQSGRVPYVYVYAAPGVGAETPVYTTPPQEPAVPEGEPDVWVREQRGTYEGVETLDPMFVFGSTNPGPGRHGATYSPRYPAAPSQPAVPQGEPVAWMLPRKGEDRAEFHEADEPFNGSFKTLGWTPLYTEPSQEPVTLTDTRPEFEAYFLRSRKSKGADRKPTFDRFDDDTYKDDHTQRHWWTWQQAIAALREKQGGV